MGNKVTQKKIEEMSSKKLQKLKSFTVKDLKPNVKTIYDRRMFLQQATA